MNHPPDEILSALIDSETVDAADAGHVAECAACQARTAALRHVATALAEPIAPPAPHLREAAVAAALVETSGASGAVRGLAMARRSRAKAAAGSARRMSAATAAAALLVALGVGGWLLSQARGQSDNTAGVGTLGALGTRPANPREADAAATPTSAYDAGDIGAFGDVQAVARKVRADLAQPPDVRAQRPYPGPDPCGHDDGEALEWHASLSYQGAAAWARVWRSTAGDRLLQVLRQTDCVLVETQAI
jgi:hypothetical protein